MNSSEKANIQTRGKQRRERKTKTLTVNDRITAIMNLISRLQFFTTLNFMEQRFAIHLLHFNARCEQEISDEKEDLKPSKSNKLEEENTHTFNLRLATISR
jgi:hypothetical protein